eukprot:8253774-Pyramimonas_sp.AAC.1
MKGRWRRRRRRRSWQEEEEQYQERPLLSAACPLRSLSPSKRRAAAYARSREARRLKSGYSRR